MNNTILAVSAALMLCTACTVSREQDCHRQAEEKFALYNKPDTYPVPDYEKTNVLTALYNECMIEQQGYTPVVDTKNAKPLTESAPATLSQPLMDPPPQTTPSYTAPVVIPPAPSPAPVAPAPSPVPVLAASPASPVPAPVPAAKPPEPKTPFTGLPGIVPYRPAPDKSLDAIIMQ